MLREQQGMPSSYTNCKLSSISDKRGMMTNVTPSSVTAESWKVRDLPPPVGIKASTDLPLLVALMISRWFSLKASLPNMVSLATVTSSSHSNLRAHSDLHYSSNSLSSETIAGWNYRDFLIMLLVGESILFFYCIYYLTKSVTISSCELSLSSTLKPQPPLASWSSYSSLCSIIAVSTTSSISDRASPSSDSESLWLRSFIMLSLG